MAVRDTAFEEPKPPQDAGAQVKVLKHKFSRRVGEILLSEGLINEQQLRLGLERQKQTGAFLVETLVSLGFVKSEVVGRYLDQATGFPARFPRTSPAASSFFHSLRTAKKSASRLQIL